MRVAVIGGGLFGCTAAIYADRAGHEVHLFERRSDIMQCATAVNQFRLHRGYHYPRSPETGRECRAGNTSFWREYHDAVITPQHRKAGGQFYAIAREGSKVSGEEFRTFCLEQNLPFRPQPTPPWLNADEIEVVLKVLESSVDYDKLVFIVKGKIDRSDITLHCDSTWPDTDAFDRVIIATYSGINEVAKMVGCRTTNFQYEVCEKPVMILPDMYRDISLVVMDGEFCSVDPYGRTGMHLLGHVKHAIHSRNTGDSPNIPEWVKPYLNAGVVSAPFKNRFWKMVDAGATFMPVLREAQHIGSLFTVRAVLPNVDATDERPTLVERLDERVVRIFSGKLGTAVDAAQEAVYMMKHQREAA